MVRLIRDLNFTVKINSNPKVIIFVHSYQPDKSLGSFNNSVIKSFQDIGCEVHYLIINDILFKLNSKRIIPVYSNLKIVNYVKKLNPDLILTINHSYVNSYFKLNINKPINHWMHDRRPFNHDTTSDLDLFTSNDIILTPSENNFKHFHDIYKLDFNQIFNIPFCTNPSDFVKTQKFSNRTFNISFVGSIFSELNMKKKLGRLNKKHISKLQEIYNEIEKDYETDIFSLVKKYRMSHFLRKKNISVLDLRGYICNRISNLKRLYYLDAVKEYGLVIFGNSEWNNLSNYPKYKKLINYFIDSRINSREKLSNIYSSSKFLININHHQAKAGLNFRFFDLLASGALPLMEYRVECDSFKYFPNLFIPRFKNKQELIKLIEYYSQNPLKAELIIQDLKKAVKSHTFQQRAKEILKINNLSFSNKIQKKIIKISPKVFLRNKLITYDLLVKIYGVMPSFIKIIIRKYLEKNHF